MSFVPTRAERQNLEATGWQAKKCGNCEATVWRGPTGALLNGLAVHQFATEESPVAGFMLECFDCNAARWDQLQRGVTQ